MEQPTADRTNREPYSDLRQTLVEGLLWPCWRGMPEGFKMRYARNIWEQFENQIRSAAYTSSLAKFFETLCRKLAIEIRAGDVAAVSDVLSHAEPKSALQILRAETTTLVLLCRLKNQERKERFEAERKLDDDLRVSGNDDGDLFHIA